MGADQHSPAQEACLLTRWGWRGLGTEAQASEVGPQEEDWGWLREHSLKRASAPQLARRESRKKSGAAEETRDFFLPLCFLVREERRLTAPFKGAPETGVSHSYQRGPQRRAWDAKTAAATTKKPVCKPQVTIHTAPPRSLCSPPLPGSHDPGTTSPGEHTVPQTGATSRWPLLPQAHPASVPLPPPGLSEPELPNQLLL